MSGCGFELDHFFVAVAGATAVAAELRAAGFEEGPARAHPGQGTASRGVFFENAYLELIWLADPAEAASPPIRRTRLLERTNPVAGACPFGIALRKTADGSAVEPFPTWDYAPPYLPEGMAIPVGRNSEDTAEPFLFVLPWRTGPGWEPPAHPNGSRRVTRLSITLEDRGTLSAELVSFIGTGLVQVSLGGPYLMEVELDGGAAGVTTALDPGISLRIAR